MPLTVIKRKVKSDNGTIEAPYWVADLTLAPNVEINFNLAVEAAVERGNIDHDSEPVAIRLDQESHKSIVVWLTYPDNSFSFPNPNQPTTPLPVGSISAAFNAVSFEPQHKILSLQTMWRLPAEQDFGPAPNFKGLVNVHEWSTPGNRVFTPGYDLVLPPETDSVEYIIPGGNFTRAYRQTVRNCLWKVHQGENTFFGTPNGEIMLVRAQARLRSGDSLALSFGFSHRPNGPRPLGDITTEDIGAPPVEGHDYVWFVPFWESLTAAPGISISYTYPRWVYCERIWERADLNALGLPGSAVEP